MKKLIVIGLVVVLVLTLGAGAVFAIPSTKTAVTSQTIDYVPGDSDWHVINIGQQEFATEIKTGAPKDLIISVSIESLLATDVKIKGKGTVDTSMSEALIEIKVEVEKDGVWTEAVPGPVMFANRLVVLRGLLWDELQVQPAENVTLPEQWIELYQKSRTANTFNFYIENLGSGVHGIRVLARIDAYGNTDDPYAGVEALIGPRTLVVHEVNLK